MLAHSPALDLDDHDDALPQHHEVGLRLLLVLVRTQLDGMKNHSVQATVHLGEQPRQTPLCVARGRALDR